ncbi:hypothetical protein EMIHUDRAFT_208015 [Emiliania huxleyi CCMP1516]|uniref:YrhK domain-containing protein n=2 Tax=Emiliania huxleyi TaxID=2903 RepID=A0A0D3JBS8_EMIH1|nr:hypothetical protein EMIHUDRAFT_208015 [Emiliania huxleyi CCMP1516]EOD20963.1 hypothetical protein EMIHUDRAFT_208015 [Emiliania huxleyi CCMP1516]|eukprot:XP_005773392.1 hypothetical protein EMIHUDRAFT_208015 [Emiliania huxleyi CCMP1516]
MGCGGLSAARTVAFARGEASIQTRCMRHDSRQRALESDGHDDDVKWLTFWFAYSFVNFAGSLFSNVFFFIPFWGEVLLGTTVFLALGGSELVLKPILLKNQEVIDKVLSKGAALKDKVVAKAA